MTRLWLCLTAMAALHFAGLQLARAELAVVAADVSYPEGPVWQGGKLYFVEYGRGTVRVADGGRIAEFWHSEHCGPSGLFALPQGHLLVACYDVNTLVELDGQGHTVRTRDRDSSGRPFIGPNDFAADGHGGVYFSASGVYDIKAPITGTVLHLRANGTIVEVADKIHYSNGLVLSGDGRTLLVAEGLAGRVLAFPVNPDGSLGQRRVWARLQDLAPQVPDADGYNGPDGIKLGTDGHYYIAQNGSGRVLVATADAQLVRTIELPERFVSNIAFGADGVASLYITAVSDQWQAPYPGHVYRWTE